MDNYDVISNPKFIQFKYYVKSNKQPLQLNCVLQTDHDEHFIFWIFGINF